MSFFEVHVKELTQEIQLAPMTVGVIPFKPKAWDHKVRLFTLDQLAALPQHALCGLCKEVTPTAEGTHKELRPYGTIDCHKLLCLLCVKKYGKGDHDLTEALFV